MSFLNYDILDCCGAYGRKANLDDWVNGLDFKVIDGPYFSIRDCKELSKKYDELHFRSAMGIEFRVYLK